VVRQNTSGDEAAAPTDDGVGASSGSGRVADADPEDRAEDEGRPSIEVDGIDVEGPSVDPREAPMEYVESVTELAVVDVVAAGDRVGDLLTVAREFDGDVRTAAGEALNLVGLLRPVEFDVWVEDVRAAAEADDEELAFLGLRALAQLAGERPQAAAAGLDVALGNLTAPRPDLRKAALSIVAEVGAVAPERVRRADRDVVEALGAPAAEVRLAGAIAAAKLLGADPAAFPRTASALFDALDDDDPGVREYAHTGLVHFALEHPEQVPEKRRAISVLADVTDADVGLREGATKEALTSLLALDPEYDL